MEQYISKSALVAEIDRQKIGYNTDGKHSVEYNTVKRILDIINTLEVKEIPETTHIEHKKIKKLCEIQRYDEDGKAYSVMLPDSRLFMNKINDVIDAIDNIDSRLQMVEQKIGE